MTLPLDDVAGLIAELREDVLPAGIGGCQNCDQSLKERAADALERLTANQSEDVKPDPFTRVQAWFAPRKVTGLDVLGATKHGVWSINVTLGDGMTVSARGMSHDEVWDNLYAVSHLGVFQPEGEAVDRSHNWIKSPLGHGESYCTQCHGTNREIAVIGDMNVCEKAPNQSDHTDASTSGTNPPEDGVAAQATIWRLIEAAKGLSFGAYPAHGSGFVCIVQGDTEEFASAIQQADEHFSSLVAAPPAPQPCRWRPEVQAFADLMEQQLRANDHKPGWKGEDAISDLFPRLIEEAEELQEALQQWAVRVGWGESALYLPQNVARVGREAADVANFAMMIADVCGAPRTPAPQPQPPQRT